MQIVINIPEDIIYDIKESYKGEDVLYCGVKYGTPLPKVLDSIKAEIEKEIEWAKEHGCDEWLGAYGVCLEIINKHIGKEKQCK